MEKRTCSRGTVQLGFALLDRHRLSKRYDPGGESQKSHSTRPRRHDRPGLVAYLHWASVASGRCGSLRTRMRKQEGEARWGLRCCCGVSAKRSEENHRTGCARFGRRGESEGFTDILGCTEGADDDRTEFGRTRQAALETATNANAEQEKQKSKPNSKEAKRWLIRTYANGGPKLGKKRSRFQRRERIGEPRVPRHGGCHLTATRW